LKRIAYIELDTHAEIAASFVALTRDMEAIECDYFFSTKILDRLNLPSDIKATESTATTIVGQLQRRSYDLVIIGTVHRYFNVFKKITQKFQTAIIVHNINFSQTKPFLLLLNVFKKETAYRLKLLLKEGLLQAPNCCKSAQLLVLDEQLCRENPKLPLQYLPVFFNLPFEKPREKVMRISIPGMVSQQRRDYRSVLKKLKQFKKPENFHFVFLGKASGEELKQLKTAATEVSPELGFTFFDSRLSQETFDEWMMMSDLLWCPIQLRTEFFSIGEIYGKTKMSGNVGDAIRYGKTAVFPAEYPTGHPFIVKQRDDIEAQLASRRFRKTFDFQEVYRLTVVRAQLEAKLLLLAQ